MVDAYYAGRVLLCTGLRWLLPEVLAVKLSQFIKDLQQVSCDTEVQLIHPDSGILCGPVKSICLYEAGGLIVVGISVLEPSTGAI